MVFYMYIGFPHSLLGPEANQLFDEIKQNKDAGSLFKE
jgi:hypothetical protein